MTIAGKAVLVTGANRGIGQALVEEALGRGAKRVYAGTRQPLTHSDGRVTPLTLDVTNAAQIQEAVERVESLAILINNAGVARFDDLTDRAALKQHLAVKSLWHLQSDPGFPAVPDSFSWSHRQRSVGGGLSSLADCSRILNLKGGRLLPVTVAACSFGGTGRERSCRLARPRGYGYVPRLRSTEGLSGGRCASHLRRSGAGGGGHLPRSHVRDHSGELAQRCGQGARASVCGARKRTTRQRISKGTRVQFPHYRKLVGHVRGILMSLPDEFRTREVISGAFATTS